MAIPNSLIVSGPRGARVTGRPGWRAKLPVLETHAAVLREVEAADAIPLAAALGGRDTLDYLPLGPTTVDHFARFIRWVRRQRRAGRYLCFAVVPREGGRAAGLFQLWPIEPGFGTAEIGFALDPSLWGTGTFLDCATAVIDFAFETLGVRRLECRSATENARGAAALRKLGAVEEGTLRQCFPCPKGVLDHTMWSILADEWAEQRPRRRKCS